MDADIAESRISQLEHEAAELQSDIIGYQQKAAADYEQLELMHGKLERANTIIQLTEAFLVHCQERNIGVGEIAEFQPLLDAINSYDEE